MPNPDPYPNPNPTESVALTLRNPWVVALTLRNPWGSRKEPLKCEKIPNLVGICILACMRSSCTRRSSTEQSSRSQNGGSLCCHPHSSLKTRRLCSVAVRLTFMTVNVCYLCNILRQEYVLPVRYILHRHCVRHLFPQCCHV